MNISKSIHHSLTATKSFTRLIQFQMVTAVIAALITIALSWQIPRLVRERAAVLAQKDALTSEVKDLTKKKENLDKLTQRLASSYGILAGTVANSNEHLANTAVTASLKSNPQLASQLPIVYFHTQSKSQVQEAQQIKVQLQQHGYFVLGISAHNNQGPPSTQVRYFHSDNPGEKEEAEKIVELLQTLGIKDAVAQFVPGYRIGTNTNAASGVTFPQYEVWFGPGSI
jgi:hypothetical protein